jgi:hypothetical protein
MRAAEEPLRSDLDVAGLKAQVFLGGSSSLRCGARARRAASRARACDGKSRVRRESGVNDDGRLKRAALFSRPNLYAVAQYVASATERRAQESRPALPRRNDLHKVLHPDFREFTFSKLSDKSLCGHRVLAFGGTNGAETALLASFWASSKVHSEPFLELSDSYSRKFAAYRSSLCSAVGGMGYRLLHTLRTTGDNTQEEAGSVQNEKGERSA